MSRVAHPLRVLIAKAGFKSVSEFSDSTPVGRATVNRMLATGYIPTDPTMVKLAEALSVEPADLYRELRTYTEQVGEAA